MPLDSINFFNLEEKRSKWKMTKKWNICIHIYFRISLFRAFCNLSYATAKYFIIMGTSRFTLDFYVDMIGHMILLMQQGNYMINYFTILSQYTIQCCLRQISHKSIFISRSISIASNKIWVLKSLKDIHISE